MEEDIYTLGSKYMRSVKGGIGEWVAWLYIHNVLAKKLKERWGEVLYEPISLSRYLDCFLSLYLYGRPRITAFRDLLDFFIYRGFLPSLFLLDFLSSKEIERIARMGPDHLVLHSVPDGIIFKLGLGKKEDRERIIKEYKNRYFSEFLTKRIKDLRERLKQRNYYLEHLKYPLKDIPLMLHPVIEGDVEIVEVKTEKGKLQKNQRSLFLECLRRGVPVRILHVEMEDFEEGIFRITQVLLKRPEDLDMLRIL
jgi:hypothetical protein